MTADESILKQISDEAERIEEDCTYSSKAHLNSSDTWNRIHYGLGVPAMGLAAFAAADVLSSFEISGWLAAFVAVLVSISTFANPSKKASEHEVVGNQYLSLSKAARRFRTIDLLRDNVDVAHEKIEDLSKRRDELNETSPNPLTPGYKKAQLGISEGQTKYMVDKTNTDES